MKYPKIEIDRILSFSSLLRLPSDKESLKFVHIDGMDDYLV